MREVQSSISVRLYPSIDFVPCGVALTSIQCLQIGELMKRGENELILLLSSLKNYFAQNYKPDLLQAPENDEPLQ